MFQGSVLKGLTEEKDFSENGQVKEMGWYEIVKKQPLPKEKLFSEKSGELLLKSALKKKKKDKNRWLKTFSKYRLHGYQILVLLLQLDITALKMM